MPSAADTIWVVSPTTETVRIGLLGCGNVGTAVARMLHDHGEDIAMRTGVRLRVTRVAVRDVRRDRDVPVPAEAFSDDPAAVVTDPDVDVVAEVMGGLEPAHGLVLKAFDAGKPVVTANKELLATFGAELFDAAARCDVDLLYEASVGGGIPLIRPLLESLAGERIVRVMGIVNGTTNHILTRMSEEGSSLAEALAEAQQLGYAEADPTADVEGFDAAAKAAILAAIAFDARVVVGDVYREGISGISVDDISNARKLGYVVKLLAIAEAVDGSVSVRVHPAMIPEDHPLAGVRHSFNAVLIEGERVGDLMLTGRGAGGDPTATSVVGDLIEAARNLRHGGRSAGAARATRRAIVPIDDIPGQYYFLLRVDDRPGVLASIAAAFAEHRVSIKSVWQDGHGDEAQLVVITHRAAERDLRACADRLRELDAVREVGSVIRVEAGEP
jgi:homoserine dehydrogenase